MCTVMDLSPAADPKWTPKPRRGGPDCRSNVENFIGWSRGLGLYNPDIFEPDDLLKACF
jgi:hypothetical protein